MKKALYVREAHVDKIVSCLDETYMCLCAKEQIQSGSKWISYAAR